VAATADDVLTLAGDIDELLLEKLGVDVELGGGGRGDDRRGAAGSGFANSSSDKFDNVINFDFPIAYVIMSYLICEIQNLADYAII